MVRLSNRIESKEVKDEMTEDFEREFDIFQNKALLFLPFLGT